MFLKYVLPPVVLLLFCMGVNAQKLPQVQKVSLRAPANAKADGKITEWGNQFEAYNKSADVWYTIANDDEKLYFVIQARNADVIHKMMRGCVTIIINTSGKKNDKNAITITFPDYLVPDIPNVSLNRRPKPDADTAGFRLKTDSFMYMMNRRLVQKQKFLVVSGLKGLADSLISVYNDIGVGAKAILDHQLNYNYELAIPLKYLGLDVSGVTKFSYNIRLNGVAPRGAIFQTLTSGRVVMIVGDATTAVDSSPRGSVMVYPTDFWGEYTLAR